MKAPLETRLVNPHECQFIQSRVFLGPDTVEEYAEMFRNELTFEPCQAVITPGGATIIYDGNHRAEAAKQAGAMLEVELTPGTEQDAEWLATGANTKHGLRRSAEDIEKAVKTALRHANGQGHSDREIARHCGCDHKTVGKYRKALEASGDVPQMPTRTVQRNGSAYQMTIPMPEPEPEETPVAAPGHQVSVFVPDEQPRPTYGPCARCGTQLTGPGHFKPEGAICDRCDALRLTFDMMWEVDRDCEQLNLSLRVRDIDPILPFLDDVAEQKGWCDNCKYAYSAHYTNEEGRKWCTLSILKNDYLKQKLHPEYINLHGYNDDEPVDHAPEAEETPATRLERCQACLGKCYFTDKGITNIYEINEIMCLVRGVTYPWPPGSQKYAAMTANFTLEELRYEVSLGDWEAAKAGKLPEPEPRGVYGACHFCGDTFPEEKLYSSHAKNGYLLGHICHACASKALRDLNEDDVFAWHTEDRERICNAGLRIFRVAWGDPRENRLEIREYLPPKNSGGSRSWQIAERFTSKADLKRRMKELDQDELTIFEHRSNS